MATVKLQPVTLMYTDGPRMGDRYRVDLVPEGRGYTFAVRGEVKDGNDEYDTEDSAPALTASEWAKVAIQLLMKCPDSKDPIGLVSAAADDLAVTGRTLGKRGKWTASLTDVGGQQDGRVLLEWSSSRPLAQWEIGKAFKAMIERLSDLSDREESGMD